MSNSTGMTDETEDKATACVKLVSTDLGIRIVIEARDGEEAVEMSMTLGQTSDLVANLSLMLEKAREFVS